LYSFSHDRFFFCLDNCTSALADTEANINVSCLTMVMGNTVYYQGNDPLRFLEALKAALSARGNFGINGLLAILGPQVTLVGSDDGTGTGANGDGTGTGTNGDGTGTGTNGDGTGTGTNGDGTGTGTNGDGTGTGTNGDGTGTGTNGDGTGTGTNGDGTGTGTNGDGTGTGTNGDGTGTGTNGDGTGTGTNGDGTGTGTNGNGTGTGTNGAGTGANGNGNVLAGVEGAEDPSNISRGDDGVSVATTVGVTAAGLALVLVVLLVAGRRRRRPEGKVDEASLFVHRQFTEEEDDDSYTRDMDAGAGAYDRNIAHVVSEDDDSVVIRWGETGDQSIYSTPIESILAADDMKFAMENHSCSSPSCTICAMKAEEGVGVRFIATPRYSNVPAPLSRDSRTYLSNDTVDL
jgi:MYXO-CTERM domain-containing protein